MGATYADEKLGETQVYPEKGNVSFSAGLHGWAFTLTTFANFYGSKFHIEPTKLTEKLWGDNFFDTNSKKWHKTHTGATTCRRTFVQFVYDPIKAIIDAAMTNEKEKLFAMTNKLC